MWESVLGFPRGYVSSRNFVTFATSLIVACFGYLLFASTPVYAADATWDGNNITYGGETYEPTDVTKAKGLKDIPKGAQVYRSNQALGLSKTVHLIYFDDGVVPKSAKEATYVVYTLNPPNEYSNPTDKKPVSLAPATENSKTVSEGQTSCAVDGVGWLVCGLSNFIADSVDTIYGYLMSFLKVTPVVGGNNSMYRLWEVMRNIANVAFVIGFLVIIYSYLAGGGFTNYEIKKIVPRLVLAAILINVSYWICAVAVDASNIVGSSLQDLLMSIRDTAVGSETNPSVGWKEVTAYVLSGGTVAAVAFMGIAGGSITSLAFLLLGLLITVAFALFVALVILAARQAIIIILVVLAPLAFAAYVLPNTEKYFEKWRGIFTTMLVLFPIFSLLFGGCQLASSIIIQNATNFPVMLFGLSIQIVPLVITPFLIQFSGGLVGRIAGAVNNGQKGLFDRSKGWANNRAEFHKDRNLARPNNRYNRLNLARRGAQRMYARDQSRKKRHETYKQDAENLAHTREFGQGAIPFTNGRRLPEGARDFLNRNSYGAWDQRYRDADLRHREIEGHHNEQWYQGAFDGTAQDRRRMMSHLQHSEGRTNLMTESLKAQDERAFQTELNTSAQYSGLRAAKVQTSVDSGVAEIHKSDIDSEGKEALSNTVKSDRALRKMKVRTFENEKRAETIDNTLKKNAEAHWDYISRTNDAVQTLRLVEVEATDAAKNAELQWTKLVEQAREKGQEATMVSSNNRALAQSILKTAIDTSTQEAAIENIKEAQKEVLLKRLNSDAGLRKVAGGGTKFGATKVLAKAQSGITQLLLDNAKAMTSIYSNDGYRVDELFRAMNPDGTLRNNEPADSVAKFAAIQYVMEDVGNNWAVEKTVDRMLRDHGMHMETDADGNPIYYDARAYREAMRNGTALPPALSDTEASFRRDTMQMVVSGYRKGKNRVSWLSNTMLESMNRGLSSIRHEDEEAAGRELTASEAAMLKEARQGKYDGKRMAEMDPDEISRMVQALRDPAFRKLLGERERQLIVEGISTAQTSIQTRHAIKPRERGLMNIAAHYLELEGDENPPPEEQREMENLYYEVEREDSNGTYHVRVPFGTPGATPVEPQTKAPNVYDMDRQDDIRPSGTGLNPPRTGPTEDEEIE